MIERGGLIPRQGLSQHCRGPIEGVGWGRGLSLTSTHSSGWSNKFVTLDRVKSHHCACWFFMSRVVGANDEVINRL